MPGETIGDTIHVETAAHPPRTDSPEYKQTRKWLMGVVAGGCYICGGPVDLSHPEAPADAHGLEDHHSGAITFRNVTVAFSLFGTEWSLGWGASPAKMQAFVAQLNEVLRVLGEPTYDLPITTTADVMAWVDSRLSASLKLCRPHHTGHQTQHTPDRNGNEACGIHNIPVPIWLGQATCDWGRFNMWGGSTGTIAVAPHPAGDGRTVVVHVDPRHPTQYPIGAELPATHPHSRAAHAGAGPAFTHQKESHA
jgi:hypothetical protein